MKPVRTSESMRVRRELAQLLRRLRAIRRQYLSQGDLLERVNMALTEAEDIRRFGVNDNRPAGSRSACTGCRNRVDQGAFEGAQELRAD